MRRKGLFSFGNTPAERSAARWLFLIGLGASTQIYIGGYTAISELLLVLFMPIAMMKNWGVFSRDRCSTILWLLIIWGFGQLATDLMTGNYFAFMIRGLIPPVGIFATLITVYPLLKRNPDGLKWLLLGTAISGVISIFVFQHGSDIGTTAVQSGEMSAAEAVMGYKLFWVNKLNEWLALPVKGWYMAMPHELNVAIAVFLAVFGLYSGGRSAFLVMAVSALFLWFGGRSSRKMLWLKKNSPLVIMILIMMLPVVKYTYQYVASHGWMGEDELVKYEEQSKGKSGLETLMAGRGEFFIALTAIVDKPLMGHGSYALDTKGYLKDFVIKHGATTEELKRIDKMEEMRGGARTIPAHSHIACFWMWAGIAGLLPWLYILVLFWKTLFRRMHVYPPYYGYFALIIPGMFWAIFFSPFGSRINMAVLIAACLVVQTMAREQRRMNGFMVKSW